ncbi:MAG: pyruvate kinase [Candidatus Helarchaeota archaeon]
MLEEGEKHEARTKIMATIGPSSESEERIRQLINAGTDIFRLNFSHGTHEWHETIFRRIRKVAPQVPILFDISGPKIRVGSMKSKYLLHRGQQFTLTSREIIGNDQIVTVNYPALPNEVDSGDMIFINDGVIALKVLGTDGEDIKCEVIAGGPISSRKGINVPKVTLSIRVPTEKDKDDIKLATELDADLLAVSFVENLDDLNAVKTVIKEAGTEIPLIAKIERANAILNYSQILKNSFGIMVARGDLGVELPTENIPMIQKDLILSCNKAGKPVIVATQMLESMTISPIPTRAETNDVFNAVLDGSDCLMLSGETASGRYPVKSVQMMHKICVAAEKLLQTVKRNPDHYDSVEKSIEEVLGHAVHRIIKTLKKRDSTVRAILVSTRSGNSAQMVAKYRPEIPIIAITFDEKVLRRLRLIWGVKPLFLDVPETMDQFSKNYKTIRLALERNLIDKDDIILFVSASFLAPRAKTSTISLYKVSDIQDIE